MWTSTELQETEDNLPQEKNRDFTRVLSKQIWLQWHVNFLPFAVCERAFEVYMQQLEQQIFILQKENGNTKQYSYLTGLQKEFTYSFYKKK